MDRKFVLFRSQAANPQTRILTSRKQQMLFFRGGSRILAGEKMCGPKTEKQEEAIRQQCLLKRVPMR